jgi:hypothetical protein
LYLPKQSVKIPAFAGMTKPLQRLQRNAAPSLLWPKYVNALDFWQNGKY